MAVHNQQVHDAVIVVIQEMRSPAHVLHGQIPEARGDRPVFERETSRIHKERMVFGVESRHHEVGPAASINIRGIDAHSRLCHTVRVVGDLGVHGEILEGPIALVHQEEIGRTVACDGKVCPAVVVNIHGHDP